MNDELGESTPRGRSLLKRLRRAMRAPLLSDRVFNAVWTCGVLGIGIALARYVAASDENMRAAVVAIVLIPFMRSAASVWTVKP